MVDFGVKMVDNAARLFSLTDNPGQHCCENR
jgi:hypothetical protein